MPWDVITLKRWHFIMGILGSFFAIIGTVLLSTPSLDAYIPATHGYVHSVVQEAQLKSEKTDAKIERRQIDTQVQVLKGRRGQIEAQISERQLLLQQPGPAIYQRMVRDQIVSFQDDLRSVQDQIDQLGTELRKTRSR